MIRIIIIKIKKYQGKRTLKVVCQFSKLVSFVLLRNFAVKDASSSSFMLQLSVNLFRWLIRVSIGECRPTSERDCERDVITISAMGDEFKRIFLQHKCSNVLFIFKDNFLLCQSINAVDLWLAKLKVSLFLH